MLPDTIFTSVLLIIFLECLLNQSVLLNETIYFAVTRSTKHLIVLSVSPKIKRSFIMVFEGRQKSRLSVGRHQFNYGRHHRRLKNRVGPTNSRTAVTAVIGGVTRNWVQSTSDLTPPKTETINTTVIAGQLSREPTKSQSGRISTSRNPSYATRLYTLSYTRTVRKLFVSSAADFLTNKYIRIYKSVMFAMRISIMARRWPPGVHVRRDITAKRRRITI